MDKQHAVISANAENREYKLHDLGTLNGVSMLNKIELYNVHTIMHLFYV